MKFSVSEKTAAFIINALLDAAHQHERNSDNAGSTIRRDEYRAKAKEARRIADVMHCECLANGSFAQEHPCTISDARK